MAVDLKQFSMVRPPAVFANGFVILTEAQSTAWINRNEQGWVGFKSMEDFCSTFFRLNKIELSGHSISPPPGASYADATWLDDEFYGPPGYYYSGGDEFDDLVTYYPAFTAPATAVMLNDPSINQRNEMARTWAYFSYRTFAGVPVINSVTGLEVGFLWTGSSREFWVQFSFGHIGQFGFTTIYLNWGGFGNALPSSGNIGLANSRSLVLDPVDGSVWSFASAYISAGDGMDTGGTWGYIENNPDDGEKINDLDEYNLRYDSYAVFVSDTDNPFRLEYPVSEMVETDEGPELYYYWGSIPINLPGMLADQKLWLRWAGSAGIGWFAAAADFSSAVIQPPAEDGFFEYRDADGDNPTWDKDTGAPA